jgi:hypothetical protein
VELVIARSASAAVYVGRCLAYPTGFELEVRVELAADAADLDPSLNGPHHRPGSRSGSSWDEMLKFGVEFSDGRKATNVSLRRPGSEAPEEPVLWGMGGGGGGGRWRQDFWVWPLPPPGPVTLVCEWPVAGIALSRAEIDAQVLLVAAGRAVAAFSEPRTT